MAARHKPRRRRGLSDPSTEQAAPEAPAEPVKAKRTGDTLDDAEFQGIVKQMAQAAADNVDQNLAKARIHAQEYYRGEPFGDEEEGRSQIVLTEVRDTVLAILPDVLRVFCSGEKVVEYAPRTAADMQAAQRAVAIGAEATDTVNYVFMEQNPGFSILHAAFKDALLKRAGIVTWWAEEEERVVEKSFSGLMQEEIVLFMQQNQGMKIVGGHPEPVEPGAPPTYCIQVRMVDRNRKYRVCAVPPEEFVFDRRARDTETNFDLIGTRQMLTVSELIERGFDREEIEEHGNPGDDGMSPWQQETMARNPANVWPDESEQDATKRVLYYKIYARIDKDGDGIAELREIHAIGDACYVLKDQVVDHAPFAVFCPDPEPHTLVGHCPADSVMDLQRIKSHVMRAVMDSLTQSIFPRMGIVEGQVNIDDALNKEVGAIIRMKQAGMVQDLSTPFVGQAAQPVLDYLDQIKAQRTGITPASQGLDADLLQSTTAQAVNTQVSSAQARIEMICRIFAETGMKQLFRGLLKLITRHQDKPLIVRLRGQFVPVDPTTWDADMDVRVNIGLGRGDDSQQLAFLAQISGKQEQIIQTLGFGNPLVKLAQYRDTLARMVQKAGFSDPSQFFGEIPPGADEQIAQAQAASKPPDPNLMLAKTEIAKTQADAFSKLQQTSQERVKMQLDAQLQREKLEADIILKTMDAATKGAPVPWQEIIQFIQRPRPDITQLTETLMDREKAVSGQVLQQIGADNDPSSSSAAPQPGAQNAPVPPQAQLPGPGGAVPA